MKHIIHMTNSLLAVVILAFPVLSYGAEATFSFMAVGDQIDAVRVTAPAAEVAVLLEEVRKVETGAYSKDMDRILSMWRSERQVQGGYPLKYKNPEIAEVVVDAYIGAVKAERAYAESLQREAPVAEVPAAPDSIVEDENSEDVQDFYDLLGSMAESTLSEKLYDYIWDYPQPSPYRRLYVASVYPEKTLERLTAATRGRTRDGRTFALDSLFTAGAASGISIVNALVHVADIAEVHPELARSNRAVLIPFVDRYALFYTTADAGRYSQTWDYVAREASLRALSVLGGRDELPLIDRIVENAPPPAPARVENARPLPALADAIKARIAGGG